MGCAWSTVAVRQANAELVDAVGGGDAAAEPEDGGAEDGADAEPADDADGDGAEDGDATAPPEPATAKYWKHRGDVRIKLGALLSSPGLLEDSKQSDAHIVTERSNLMMTINRELPLEVSPPLSAMPKYMESLSSLSVSCAVGFPMTLLGSDGPAPERTFGGPFGRAVYARWRASDGGKSSSSFVPAT